MLISIRDFAFADCAVFPLLNYAFPPEYWEKRVREHIRLMNYWYKEPHWDYDRRKLCFIEISDSKENDGDGIEEPRPGSVIRTID